MIHLWIMLIFLHRANSLISVTTGQLGKPVTFTCQFSDSEYSNTRVKWYKQSIGDTLILITTLMKATGDPTFEQGFSPSRFEARYSTVRSTLTILTTIPEDEALYHCSVSSWSKNQWSGTLLSVKENNRRASDYTVVQWSTVSDPVQPGDSVTLHCSVLSASERKSCPDEHSVHWFGVRSDKSMTNVIYTDGTSAHECDDKPEASSPSRSCVYRFSKNINASDAGTFYCAVATCGEIIFGNGTKLNVEGTGSWSVGVLVSCVGGTLSVIVTAVLICVIRKNKCDSCKAFASLQENVAKRSFKTEADLWLYSAVVFTVVNTGSGGRRDAKAVERERIYAAVEVFGVD